MSLITPATALTSETNRDEQYLRVVLRTDALGEVVRRDFLVPDAFGPLVKSLQSALFKAGVLEEGNSYFAVVVPRFGDRRNPRPKVTIDPKKVADRRSKWISYEFEEGIRPQEAVTFFSVEIRVVDKDIVYRTDCLVSDLDFIPKRLEPVLVQTGVMKNGDVYVATMYARQESEANLRGEEMAVLKQRASELIELEPVESVSPVYPVTDLAAFDINEILGT